ncbi:MAG TPA: histidine kinase [Candidatus Limnocylindria bacterium]|nr:histidine kinase [Candidatus Limnocylindria bacterium]
MEQNLIEFSRRYRTALRRQLKPGRKPALRPALLMGRRAVALGVETLGLARIHEDALARPPVGIRSPGQVRQAAAFFAEANLAIEETHGAAQKSRARLNRLEEKLGQRTLELAASNRQLERGVTRRKAMEEAFRKRNEHHKKCLEESLALQKRLRQLTHRVLAAQEDERNKISHELQDEIAQTLLGINVRLLSLKREARSNTKGFKTGIASTQRLVASSAKSVRQVGREIGRL